MSSVPLMNRDATQDDDDWTDVRSPRLPQYTADDVRYAIAAARCRHMRGTPISAEVDFGEAQIGGRDPELAADIQESVAELWDR